MQITVESVGWRRLDITETVQKWFLRPGERLQLLVDCSSCAGEFEASLFTTKKHKGAHKPRFRRTEASHRPFIVTHTSPTPSKRVRRALQCDKDTPQCCKSKLFVSFQDLGWQDWIIAPAGYQANYCKGSCSSIYRTVGSFNFFYSTVLEEMKRKNLPGPKTGCCAPTRLSPMSLIYLDEKSNIIMRDVPRMIVEECGCA